MEIIVNNNEPYALAPNSRAPPQGSCVVVVKVQDEDEGPLFNPCVYILNIKECLPGGTVVGNYPAKDPETGNSEDIRYGILLPIFPHNIETHVERENRNHRYSISHIG